MARLIPKPFQLTFDDLPSDVRNDIFKLTVIRSSAFNADSVVPRSQMELHPLPRASQFESPLNLVQVCRHWRARALALPELWQRFTLGARMYRNLVGSMVVYVPYRSSRDFKIFVSRALARKRVLPLSVDVDFNFINNLTKLREGSADLGFDGRKPVLRETANHAFWKILEPITAMTDIYERIESLRMMIPTFPGSREFAKCAMYSFFLAAKSHQQMMKTMSITCADAPSCAIDLTGFEKLEKLELFGGFPTRIYANDVSATLDQVIKLRSLILVDPSPDSFVYVGLADPASILRIERLQISFTDRWFSVSGMNDEDMEAFARGMQNIVFMDPLPAHLRLPCALSTITSLDIRFGDPSMNVNHSHPLFQLSIFPNLEELRFEAAPGCPSIYMYLDMMLLRSNAPVRKMVLKGVPLRGNEFLRCLKAVSGTLEELEVDGSLLTDPILGVLTFRENSFAAQYPASSAASWASSSSSKQLCPHLKKLVLNKVRVTSMEALEELVISRIKPVRDEDGVIVGAEGNLEMVLFSGEAFDMDTLLALGPLKGLREAGLLRRTSERVGQRRL